MLPGSRSPSLAVAIGIDVGGTSTRVGGVDEAGRLMTATRMATAADASGDALIAQWIGGVERVRAELQSLGARAERIGLALPGILDPGHRVLARSINLPALEGRPLADELERHAGSGVVCVTDAGAATWAEYSADRPRSRRFAHIRLGTGVACGVVVDGHLLDLNARRFVRPHSLSRVRTSSPIDAPRGLKPAARGARSIAHAHLDALVVDESSDAPECRCGWRGCLEAVASGVALSRQAKRAAYVGGLAELQTGWERGEQAAVHLVEEAARATLSAVTNLARRFACQVVVVGGGVTLHLPALLDVAIERHRASCRTAGASVDLEHALVLRRARLDDDAGVIGAALVALGQRKRVESERR